MSSELYPIRSSFLYQTCAKHDCTDTEDGCDQHWPSGASSNRWFGNPIGGGPGQLCQLFFVWLADFILFVDLQEGLIVSGMNGPFFLGLQIEGERLPESLRTRVFKQTLSFDLQAKKKRTD